MSRELPANPDLDQLKNQAKDLHRALRSGVEDAIARIAQFHPKFAKSSADEIAAAELKLADAQLVVAREYGFESWPRLKSHVESLDVVDLHELVTEEDRDALLKTLPDALERDPDSLNRLNKSGLPPLYTAALYSNQAAVQFLLDNGANVDIFACGYLGRGDDARALLADDRRLATATTPDQMTALHYAARAGKADVASVLLEHGADPNARDKRGRTPLVEACHGGPWKPGLAQDVIELLLEHDVDVDLHTAAGMGRVDLIEGLLDGGADIDALNKRGQTPLFVAAHNNCFDAVKRLVERGADVNRSDAVGAAALHRISQQCSDALIQYLIDHGADAHLCCYVACGDVAGAQGSLAQEPDAAEEDFYGFNAVGYAIHSWQLETLRLLMRHGCELNDEDRQHILRISRNDEQLLNELLALRP